jgi:hypothetical protein
LPDHEIEQLKKFGETVKLGQLDKLSKQFATLRKELHDYIGTDTIYSGVLDTNDRNHYNKSLKNQPPEVYTNKNSKKLYESLTEEQLEKLRNYFEFDYYVYSKTNF